MTRLLLMVFALLVSGCATRGTIDIDCPRFDTAVNGADPFRTPLPPTALERDILGLPGEPAQQFASDPIVERQADRLAQVLMSARGPGDSVPEINVLLLSGGGQWGAFGAGFMNRLAERGEFPEFRFVTGVSTGGLQSLFVSAGLLAGQSSDQLPYRERMLRQYSPQRESQIVNRNPQLLAIVTGSMAGLRPLRRKIERALCPNFETTGQCSMIDHIANSPMDTLIGFIDAEDGRFYYADVRRIAAAPDLSPLQRQQCITGAALASAAMPAFFQQVRINRRTYYDGGVRQSVFADFTRMVAERAVQQAHGQLNLAAPPLSPQQIENLLTLYALRNGPTSLRSDEGANNTTNVIDAALRAEAIVVNQLEVGSIAALRLQHPRRDLFFRSADGWEAFPFHDEALGTRTCGQRKDRGVMFDPDFMQCIMAYGDHIARGAEPWRTLRPISR